MITYPIFEWCFEQFMDAPGRVITAIVTVSVLLTLIFRKGSVVLAVLEIAFLPIGLYLLLWISREIAKTRYFFWAGIILQITVDVCIFTAIVVLLVYVTEPIRRRFRRNK